MRRNPLVAAVLANRLVGDPANDRLIEASLEAAWALDDEDQQRDACLAQSLAFQAMRLRREGDLLGAKRILLTAARHGEVCGDLVAAGAVAEATADVHRASQWLDTAWASAVKACAYYRAAQARKLLGRAELTKAMVLLDMNEGREALFALAPAVVHIDRQNPRLLMVAVYNLALALAQCGLFDQVDALLAEASSVFEIATPQDRARVAWGVAAICVQRDKPQQAEAYYRQARQGFAAAGVASSVALITLDLCEKVLLPQGKTAEIRALVEETVPVLERLGLETDGLRAWRLLQAAMRVELAAVTRMLPQLLRASRSKPS